MVAPYQVFPTRDGELMIAGGNDRLFAAVCDVVGSPELVADPRFTHEPRACAHRDELYDAPRASGCAGGHRELARSASPRRASRRRPVANVRDVVESPQTAALGDHAAARASPDPDLQLAALPLSLDRERVRARRAHRPTSVPTPPRCCARRATRDEEIAELATPA